jgi:Zeta toxin
MGAGKGYTIQWLYDKGLFPLKAFVKVDPDSLRELLPETREYIARNPHMAGNLTQKEVGYIAEVSWDSL